MVYVNALDLLVFNKNIPAIITIVIIIKPAICIVLRHSETKIGNCIQFSVKNNFVQGGKGGAREGQQRNKHLRLCYDLASLREVF